MTGKTTQARRAARQEALDKQEKKEMDQRFTLFKRKLNMVGKFAPRALYLYPVMRSTAFQDTETALDSAIIAYGERADRSFQKLDPANNPFNVLREETEE